jgi:hypothetical protein
MNSVVGDWMDKQIWPQIHAMIVNDTYFRVFEQAREITGKFNGHIAQLVHDGYLTSQMVDIRRLCDKGDDVVSLWRALIQAKTDVPHAIELIEATLQNLNLCSHHVRTQVNQHIAHNADPDLTRKPVGWSMQMKHLTEAHEAICKGSNYARSRYPAAEDFDQPFPRVSRRHNGGFQALGARCRY